jgi:septal ring factor EnvC (AmiA/AmiB activator)
MKSPWQGALLGLGLLIAAPPLAAEVFKCIDAAGKVIYGERKEPKMKCTPVTAEITVVPALKAPPPAQAKEQDPTEKQREELEKKIQEQELALAQAKKELAEQEGTRLLKEIYYQNVLDRLKPFQDKVAELEKALAQSRAELAQLK